MNGALVVLGVAVASICLMSFIAHRSDEPGDCVEVQSSVEDQSSLEEDLEDIVAFVPLDEVTRILKDYLMYDEQIADTVDFIEDQKRFLLQEFRNMFWMQFLTSLLRCNGLQVERWQSRIEDAWASKPKFVRADPSIACGGLTMMVSRILKELPLEELHELLVQKKRHSRSFRSLLRVLGSEYFAELCAAVEGNATLHRHYFWAREQGIEVTFALELLRDLFVYLTEDLR